MSKTPVTIQLNAIDGFSNQFSKIENNIKLMSGQFQNLGKEGNQNFDKLSFNLRKTSDDFSKLAKNIETSTNKSKKLFGEFGKGLFNGFNEITAPFNSLNNKINHSLSTGLFSADDLNTNMKRISSIAHITGKEFDNLKIKAEDTAKSIGTSTSDFSGIMLTAIRSAVQTSDGIINSSKLGSMFAKDLHLDPAFALKSLVRLTHAYGEGEDKFTDSADLMVWMKEISGSDMNEINTGLEDSAPVAKSFNLPKTDLAAIYSQMAIGGVEGSKAGTAIKNMLFRTVSPKMLFNLTKGNPKLAKSLEDEGINPTFDMTKMSMWDKAAKVLDLDPNKIWQNGKLQFFEYLIPQLQKAQKNLSPEIYGSALEKMFGKHGIAGINKMAASAENGGTDIFKTRDRIQGYKGQTAIQYKAYQESLRGKLDQFNSQVNDLKVKIVDSGLLEYAIKFVDFLSKCISKIIEFGNQNPIIFKTMLIFAGIVTVGFKLLSLVANVAQGFWALEKAFTFLRDGIAFVITKVGGFFTYLGYLYLRLSTLYSSFMGTILTRCASLFGYIMMGIRVLMLFLIANPLVAIIAAIVIGIGYIIYKNWDTVKKFLIDTWDWIKETFLKAVNSFSEAFDKVKNYISKIKGIFTSEKEELLKDTDVNANITKNTTSTYQFLPFYLQPAANKAQENKSIIELNIKNAPKESTITSKNYGNNAPKINLANMGHQDLAYE